jgi:hypothetical protein
LKLSGNYRRRWPCQIRSQSSSIHPFSSRCPSQTRCCLVSSWSSFCCEFSNS